MTTGNNASWMEQQKKSRFIKGWEAIREALHFLKISPTNRIVTVRSAQLLLSWRFSADSLMNGKVITDDTPSDEPWRWMHDFADSMEKYQLTVGVPKNSREAFVEGLHIEMLQEAKQKEREGLPLV